MVLPLIEVIGGILDKGQFDNCKESSKKLRDEIEKLVILYKQQRDQVSARQVYSAIVDLARIGKGNLAKEFALRFEKEIGYYMLS